jgi:hypothetical protein
MRTRSDPEVHMGCRDPEVAEEGIAHPLVVVLARVKDDVLGAPRESMRDGSQFDELRAGADHAEDLHDTSVAGRARGTFS